MNVGHAKGVGPASGLLEAPATGWRASLHGLDRWLGIVTEIPAAALVLADIVVLFTGVVARYVFHDPIVWTDELAGILFLWMSMLGAVVALRRGEHMRMTAFVAKASPGTRAFLDVLALAASLAFLLLIAHPAFEYASEEAIVVTPALEISNAWRASALPVGVLLMIVVSVLRLLQVQPPGRALKALALVGLVCLAFWMLAPVLAPLGKANLVIFFAGVVGACVFAGVPIGFSFALATFGFLSLTTRTPMIVLVGRMDEGMSHLILLAIPLFVFLGLLIEMTGMARAMVQFLASLLGHVRGGLSYVLVGAMYLVSGISGSKAADMAAIAPVTEPMVMSTIEGGMVSVWAPVVASSATRSPGLAPRFFISGNSTGAMAAMSAALEPEMPDTRYMAPIST